VTPLIAALAGRHFQAAKFLHDNDAHPNVRGYNEATPLHSAALYGDLEMVQVLLEYKADVNARHVYGETPLHFVSGGPFPGIPNVNVLLSKIARLLLEHNADINALGDDHSTPLHAVAQSGRLEVVRVLLEHVVNLGAEDNNSKTSFQVMSEYVNAHNANDKTTLQVLSKSGYGGYPAFTLLSSKVAQLLLEHSADVNARGNDHSTPLHAVAQSGKPEVVRVLLEHVANLGAEDDGGKTSFQVMSEYVNAWNVKDKTPLQLLSENGYGGDPDFTLLLSKVARLLLEHGADVNTQGNDHSTPLHAAARTWSVGVIWVLLEYGANVAAEDEDGKTASQVASDMGNRGLEEITKLLSEHCAR